MASAEYPGNQEAFQMEGFFNTNYLSSRPQPSEIESVGQTLAHAPQEMQVSASISYWSAPSDMALTGHSDSQAPHLMHESEILYATVIFTSWQHFSLFCDILSFLYMVVKLTIREVLQCFHETYGQRKRLNIVIAFLIYLQIVMLIINCYDLIRLPTRTIGDGLLLVI